MATRRVRKMTRALMLGDIRFAKVTLDQFLIDQDGKEIIGSYRLKIVFQNGQQNQSSYGGTEGYQAEYDCIYLCNEIKGMTPEITIVEMKR